MVARLLRMRLLRLIIRIHSLGVLRRHISLLRITIIAWPPLLSTRIHIWINTSLIRVIRRILHLLTRINGHLSRLRNRFGHLVWRGWLMRLLLLSMFWAMLVLLISLISILIFMLVTISLIIWFFVLTIMTLMMRRMWLVRLWIFYNIKRRGVMNETKIWHC